MLYVDAPARRCLQVEVLLLLTVELFWAWLVKSCIKQYDWLRQNFDQGRDGEEWNV